MNKQIVFMPREMHLRAGTGVQAKIWFDNSHDPIRNNTVCISKAWYTVSYTVVLGDTSLHYNTLYSILDQSNIHQPAARNTQ